MIGGLILLVGFGYFVLSKYIIKNTYEKYGTKKAKYIATAIMVLIPTWDIVLGYPIYAYLCLTNSGVKIYQTVENVEGFYVGEKSKDHSSPEPYKGYRYVDYKEKESGKYYRNSWLDNNTSELCVPVGKYLYSDYAKAFKQGRCVAKEEIAEGAVSRWEIGQQVNNETIVIPNYITRWTARIIDKSSHQSLSELVNYDYGEGWVAMVFSSVAQYARWSNCTLKKNYEGMLLETLKPKKGEN